ncbi:hypothetical protein D0817_20030 [Flavobacterium cupreum]|uniref:Uncharacterized protein n=1 Tax=Flavobacterium cupreum TaxID=2133766 RepID=A0A434A2N3_9FLAO|nr:hypothetical protein [Flavobacterium cupreum]RUT68651.1 hypothetical protein D0817_20030 [Flavobacterium cupreum]
MLYNPEKPIDVQRAVEKFKYFVKHNKVFELSAKKVSKTYPQLKYAHLIMSWFAIEYGEQLEYIKFEYFKKLVNSSIFEYEFINRKTGEVRIEYKSLADLTKDELSLAIDRFRDYASKEAGIYLPEPSDLALMREVEIQVKNNLQYL